MSNQPIRKTQTRAAERERARQHTERRDTITRALPFVIGAAIVLFIVVAVFLVFNQTATGAPRLQVDREKIDLGNRVFNQPVRATFTVKNAGDGALKLETPQVATVLEGC
ncbi:hypothetical protein ANRL3_00014 [Anaerolineae bacterium]|nr:hypothetical protein ANRL3_00014 [Anaerolineae bacterium]